MSASVVRPAEEQPATATGAAVDALIDAVKKDVGAAAGHLMAAAALVTWVAREARGVNGLAVACNGWADHITTLLGEMDKEVSDVERKYRGEVSSEPMHEQFDAEHAERVARARTEQPEAS